MYIHVLAIGRLAHKLVTPMLFPILPALTFGVLAAISTAAGLSAYYSEVGL